MHYLSASLEQVVKVTVLLQIHFIRKSIQPNAIEISSDAIDVTLTAQNRSNAAKYRFRVLAFKAQVESFLDEPIVIGVAQIRTNEKIRFVFFDGRKVFLLFVRQRKGQHVRQNNLCLGF